METLWWSFQFGECPKCDTPLICREILFSADMELIFKYLCPNSECRMEIQTATHAGRLAAIATRLDIEKAIKQELREFGNPNKQRPINPPLKKPVNPKELLSDEQFLKSLGISDAKDIPLLPPPDKEER